MKIEQIKCVTKKIDLVSNIKIIKLEPNKIQNHLSNKITEKELIENFKKNMLKTKKI